MKLTSIVFCLALLGGALTSCIDEDIDDCFSINRLTLSYKGDGTTEIFPDKICRLFQLPYQISCLVLVLFNAFCITMYDDVGN